MRRQDDRRIGERLEDPRRKLLALGEIDDAHGLLVEGIREEHDLRALTGVDVLMRAGADRRFGVGFRVEPEPWHGMAAP